jgi:hypothetical protein
LFLLSELDKLTMAWPKAEDGKRWVGRRGRNGGPASVPPFICIGPAHSSSALTRHLPGEDVGTKLDEPPSEEKQ